MNKTRISEQEAGYLELPGATKDADCSVVQVGGGVSSERGCCNSFGWKNEDVEGFRCGECKYVEGADGYGQNGKPGKLSKKNARAMTFSQILEDEREAEE